MSATCFSSNQVVSVGRTEPSLDKHNIGYAKGWMSTTGQLSDSEAVSGTSMVPTDNALGSAEAVVEMLENVASEVTRRCR
jgi:hypothetical protein